MIREIYTIIRRTLPYNLRGKITRFLYSANLKPTVNPSPQKRFKRGIIVFSADFEMAWAFRYSKAKAQEADEIGLHERNNVPIFIELFERFRIPVTWATVGHLFLEKCQRNEQGIAHIEMARPPYFNNRNWLFNTGDWYDHDPCTDRQRNPAWYAPDLIELINQSSVGHEIGCHSFSHIDLSYRNCPPEVANSELDACIVLAQMKGINLKSIIFPGGTNGNYEIIHQKGFTCYRKPMKYHIDMPFIDKYGLVAIPSSLGLDKDSYGWSVATHLAIIEKFIEKVIHAKQVCHFWFHPSMDEWYLKNVMTKILERVSMERDLGSIELLTMGNLAERVI